MVINHYESLLTIMNYGYLWVYGDIICHYLPEGIGLLWAIQDGAPQL